VNFYATPHKHYCGVDLHARTMYVCILSQQGAVLLHRNLPCDRERFILAIQPPNSSHPRVEPHSDATQRCSSVSPRGRTRIMGTNTRQRSPLDWTPLSLRTPPRELAHEAEAPGEPL
jgi:hypothetical protein